ncbi:MAG: hypothetical protein ACOYMA_02310 [Bacteroidia bacterium]
MFEFGNDTSIVCGELFQLNAEAKWKQVNSGTTKRLSAVSFLNGNKGFVV